jgi:transcriptional regulator with XRE-family HTH domain
MGNKSIGAVLRELRHKRNLTIVQLGQAAGVDASVISRAETGQRSPTSDTLIKLAGPLSASITDLLKQAGKIQ